MKIVAFFGLLIMLALACFLSENIKKISFKTVISGILLQLFLGFLVFGVPWLDSKSPISLSRMLSNGVLKPIFKTLNESVTAIINYAATGSEFVFGNLMNVSHSGFIFAFQVLPTILFISSLTALLYHLGIMQKVVSLIALVFRRVIGTSGAESLSMAANVFVGQTEAPLIISPYIETMTRSELMAVMSGGMATVSGGVLAAYVGLLKNDIPGIAGHLITASVMSAPIAFVFAKIFVPETGRPNTMTVQAFPVTISTLTSLKLLQVEPPLG